MITRISGNSSFFNGSLVTYTNKSKFQLLDVNEQVIKKHGAVGKQVVEQMAQNVRLNLIQITEYELLE